LQTLVEKPAPQAIAAAVVQGVHAPRPLEFAKLTPSMQGVHSRSPAAA